MGLLHIRVTPFNKNIHLNFNDLLLSKNVDIESQKKEVAI